MKLHAPTWLVIVLLMSVTISTSVKAAGHLGRGKRWVRSHPFTTMALTLVPGRFDADDYHGANMTTVLSWKTKDKILERTAAKGLPWHQHVYPHPDGLTDELKAKLTGLHEKYPGQTGWLIWDEPKRPQMFIAAKTIKWLRQKYPDQLIYSNAYPMGATAERYYGGEVPEGGYSYEDYMRDFSTIMEPDVVMFDAYPFHESGSTSNLFPTLNAARKVAQERKVPYWAFVQSYSDPGRGYRQPSESDVRMQVYMHLAYGFTGIAYFTYEQLGEGDAMISESRERFPIYYDIARLNQEVANVGQALRFMESTDVRYVPSQGNPVPQYATAWEPGTGGDQTIKTITIEGTERAEWKAVLIGFFKDDHGRDYYMLTNLWHDKDATAAQRAVTVTLTLQPGVNVVGRLSRETGHPESLVVRDNRFQLTLPGGTGELLRFGDADFPGLDD